ncbi:MAG: S-layer homology domain-containing protein [Lachnospiraceae bacterium]|nr:S-layer homology domain-containing protein [Lachnospiraceae bacterium]
MGITSGINKDGTIFGINDACTRGQIVTFLWRAAGSQEPHTDQNVFTDVKETSPFYKAILWATEMGITSGMTDTLFGIDMSCTRGQAVTFIYRYAHTPEYTNGAVFKDVPEKMFCYKAVSWAVEQDITKGTDKAGTLFSPNAFCTRGQIVTFLYRYQN